MGKGESINVGRFLSLLLYQFPIWMFLCVVEKKLQNLFNIIHTAEKTHSSPKSTASYLRKSGLFVVPSDNGGHVDPRASRSWDVVKALVDEN